MSGNLTRVFHHHFLKWWSFFEVLKKNAVFWYILKDILVTIKAIIKGPCDRQLLANCMWHLLIILNIKNISFSLWYKPRASMKINRQMKSFYYHMVQKQLFHTVFARLRAETNNRLRIIEWFELEGTLNIS